MGLTGPLVWACTLVAILMVVVMVTGYFSLLNLKAEMVWHLRPFVEQLANRGMLTEDEKASAIQQMEGLGLGDATLVIGNEGAGFGETMEFTVEGAAMRATFEGFLLPGFLRQPISYHRTVWVRRIFN